MDCQPMNEAKYLEEIEEDLRSGKISSTSGQESIHTQRRREKEAVRYSHR